MSGIFDLFGGTGNAAKQQSLFGPTDMMKKSTTSSTMFGGGMASKNAGLSRAKPKGLSIRSGNDLNISNLSIKTSKSPIKKSPIKGLLKSEVGQTDGISQSLSPYNKAKTMKMQIMKSKQLKALSSKAKSPESEPACERKLAEESIFKKPVTPRKTVKKAEVYPDAEKLAFCHDFENDINDFTLDTEFCKLLKLSKTPVKPYEDEGFESDPETRRLPSPLGFNVFVAPHDDDSIGTTKLELPSLSDDDDFWDEN